MKSLVGYVLSTLSSLVNHEDILSIKQVIGTKNWFLNFFYHKSNSLQSTRIFFNKKPVYKKPRTTYPQITPNLRNFKNYKKKKTVF